MTEAPPRDAPRSATAREGRTGEVRRDIEGLRAVAVGTVLLFHAGSSTFSGGFVGVDVFFVLSGFLITGLLVREVRATGRVRLGRFWARRARRLLPAAAVVLTFSAFVSWTWLPVTQRSVFGGDIVAAALYVVNWRLADRSVDYLAEDVVASPVQHFWSLAVEEQFYLLWPLLVLAVAVVFARRPLRGAFLVLGTVTVASFAWSVAQSVQNPQTAFFVSTTRVWELGVGALLALAAPRVARVPERLRALAGWVGLAAIAWATVAHDGTTTWPGTAALLPVLGAAAVIASGTGPAQAGPGRLLGTPALVWVGGLSYSLYLWHWPVLVAGEAAIDDFGTRHGLALVLLAVVPAYLSRRYVEDPVRFGPRYRSAGRALRLGAVLTVVGVLTGLVLAAAPGSGGVVEQDRRLGVGAGALVDPEQAGTDWAALRTVDAMTPLPAEAPDDYPPFYDARPECQSDVPTTEPVVCEFGDPDAERVVVLVGDSKAAQWQPVLDALARDEGWRLVHLTKTACSLSLAVTFNGVERYSQCDRWVDGAMREILALDPDLVITSGRRTTALPSAGAAPQAATREAMVQGLAAAWSRLTRAGIPVAALLDNPVPMLDGTVYDCVAENLDDLRACSFDRAEAIAESGAPVQRAAAERVPGVELLDLTAAICPGPDRCAPVIGDVLIYRQGSHVTATYARTAAPELAAALDRATEGRFGSGPPR